MIYYIKLIVSSLNVIISLRLFIPFSPQTNNCIPQKLKTKKTVYFLSYTVIYKKWLPELNFLRTIKFEMDKNEV